MKKKKNIIPPILLNQYPNQENIDMETLPHKEVMVDACFRHVRL